MSKITKPKGFNGDLRSVRGIFLLASQYEKRKMPFSLTGINGAYKLEKYNSDGSVERYFSKYKTSLTPKDLGFVKKVKNHVIRENIAVKFLRNRLTTEDVTYIDMARYEDGTEFDDVWEIDIDEAYWKTALMLDVIDQKIYDEGSKYKTEEGLTEIQISHRKMVRLIALGSLAKKERRYEFKGKRIILKPDQRSESVKATENIWYTICKRVSDCMQEAKKSVKPEDYVMYWVDGIYIRGESNIKTIQDVFTKWGYRSKIKRIERVSYDKSVCSAFTLKTDEKPRTFHLPSVKKTKNITKSTIQEMNIAAVKYSK